jgi:hypothetical protein
MGINKAEWKKVGAFTAISIFIGGGLLAFYGGREAFRYYNKYQLNKGKDKILEDLKATIKTSPASAKKPITDEEVDALMKSWKDDLDKLSLPALEAFIDYFNAVVPLGKCDLKDALTCPTNSWIYEVKNPDEFEKKKAAINKFNTFETKEGKLIEYYDGTRLTEKFIDFENRLKYL